jgi:hypothetical protein
MIAVPGIRWTVPLVALLATAPATAAQGPAPTSQTRLAVVIGPSINKLSGSGTEGDTDLGSYTGMHVGVSALVPLLGRWLSVSAGALYVDKGHTFAGGTASLKLSFLEVAPLLRVSLPVGSAFDLVAFGGPGFALSFGCVLKIEEEDDQEQGIVERTVSCTNEDFLFKGTDITAIVGAGVAIPLNPRASLLLNAALDTSLRTIDSSSAHADLRNRTWLIDAGVSFPLSRR